MYFHGEGSGHESLIGNPDPNDTNKDQTKPTPVVKQSFFFGSPGCLKNRPMTAFGTSSLFGFAGQTTFGASSSSAATKEEENKEPETVEKDLSKKIKPCNRFTMHKSLDSLPVTKLGNTQISRTLSMMMNHWKKIKRLEVKIVDVLRLKMIFNPKTI